MDREFVYKSTPYLCDGNTCNEVTALMEDGDNIFI